MSQDFLNRHANYEDFPNAMLVLFRMSTGESWNGIMHDTMIKTACWTITDPTHEMFGEWFNPGDPNLAGLKEHPSEGKVRAPPPPPPLALPPRPRTPRLP